MPHPLWEIDVLYRLGSAGDTRTHQTRVRSKDENSAAEWGAESLKRKMCRGGALTEDEIEIVKVNVNPAD